MSMTMRNPMAAIPDEQLERQYEQQHRGLANAVREGDLERAKQMQSALSTTETEMKARGLHGGSIDRVTA